MKGGAIVRGGVWVAIALLLGGCLTASKPAHETKYWLIEAVGGPNAIGAPQVGEATPGQVVRTGNITVMPPWDNANIMVRRSDGSLARDPYNLFASQPAALLKAPLLKLAAMGGNFGHVLAGATAANPDLILELTVGNLVLDCSATGRRTACVSLTVTLVSGMGRKVVAEAAGEASADASSGDYTAAFSEAFTQAARSALANLK